uniref:Putative secreted protein n=1 Tax=Ixodes ricinus TaxID=34613 RepID=A0A6B0UKC0_IXORI
MAVGAYRLCVVCRYLVFFPYELGGVTAAIYRREYLSAIGYSRRCCLGEPSISVRQWQPSPSETRDSAAVCIPRCVCVFLDARCPLNCWRIRRCRHTVLCKAAEWNVLFLVKY